MHLDGAASPGKSNVAWVFLIIVGLLICSIGITYWTSFDTVAKNRELTGLQSIIGHLDRLLLGVTEAETSQRGYLLVGREPYLDPYNAAVATIHTELATLDELAASRNLPKKTVATITDLTGQKLAELDQTIKEYRQHGPTAALATVFSDRGQRLMEELRSSMRELRATEENKYAATATAAGWAAVMRTVIFLVMSLGNLAILIWAYRRISRAIVECENAVAETDRQRELLATTLASIGDGVIVTDSACHVTFINPVATSLTGWKAEEADGRSLADVFHIIDEQTRAAVDSPAVQVMRTGTAAVLGNHTLLVGKDGREVPIDDSGAPVCRPDGTVRGAVLVFRDVTESRRVEESLREREERFRQLFQQAAIGIKRLDFADERLLEVNDRLCDILGYPREELLGMSLAEFTHPEDLPLERNELARLVAGEIPCSTIEKRCLRKGGGIIWVRVTNSLPTDGGPRGCPAPSGGAPATWWISVVEEITERKRADESLRRTTTELTRSNRDLEQFAYAASHDLQEPLRMVAGYLQLLSERYRGRLDEKADKFIAYAVDGAERMSGLVRDLLAYSRVNSRGEQFERTNAEEALAFALKNLASAVEETGASVHYDPLPMVRADRTQLRQVFQNLIGNAVKFHSPDRSPEIHVSAHDDDHFWHFVVEDNGIGFDDKYKDKMFLIFQRLQGRGKFPGTGIGLALCKRIVERHGGQIWAHGRPGDGAAFHFTIPRDGAS